MAVPLWFCMNGALEGYKRAIGHMASLERDMGLRVTTECKRSHWVPYRLLLLTAGLLATGAAVFTSII